MIGRWKSPITRDLVSSSSLVITETAVDPIQDEIYSVEMRPWEEGRSVIVRNKRDGKSQEVMKGTAVKTTVHEYGGGSFAVYDKRIVFSHAESGRVCEYHDQDDSLKRGNESEENSSGIQFLTPHNPNWRYADFSILPDRSGVFCIREDHSDESRGSLSVVNEIVFISFDFGVSFEPKEPKVILSGNDFYSSPRLDKNGNRLLWITWNHPNMPWTSSQLFVADYRNGNLENVKKIAGEKEESVSQPLFSPDGKVVFASDKSGYYQLYSWEEEKGTFPLLSHPTKTEFAIADWKFNIPTFGFLDRDTVLATSIDMGVDSLVKIHVKSGTLEKLDLPLVRVRSLRTLEGNKAIFVAGSHQKFS